MPSHTSLCCSYREALRIAAKRKAGISEHLSTFHHLPNTHKKEDVENVDCLQAVFTVKVVNGPDLFIKSVTVLLLASDWTLCTEEFFQFGALRKTFKAS